MRAKSSSRQLAAVAAVLVLVALVLAFFLQRSGARGARATAETVARPAEATREPLIMASSPARTVEPTEATMRVEEEPTPRATNDATACVVLGRVVDENQLALAGVPVGLSGWKGWADGHDVPRLPGKHDLRGWETRTGADGAFRFAVPVPTIERTSLRIAPDPFHDSVWVTLGGDEADTRPPLHAGANDLGTFLLAATGAIRGSVLSEAGRPLAEVNARIANDPATTLEREAVSDARGTYLIGGVKPGSYGVAVDCEGYLSDFRKPFQVEVGRITEGADFVLRAAPTLRGHVVDEDGNGIAEARLQGRPTTSGRGASGKSAADGSFTLFLPKDEPYTLAVEREGYDSFGLDRSTRYPPGTDDLRIVLRRSANGRTRFVVVDAATGARITRFGLEIERDRGSASDPRGWTSYRADPRPASHPEGELEVHARPGRDRFTVQAPGYVPLRGDVQHVTTGDARQVVALVTGGTLTGRVLAAGAPAADATVRLQVGRGGGANRAFEPDLDTAFQTTADREGCFRFDMLDPGAYQLVARGAGGTCAELLLAIPERGNVDVGTLALVPGATILGQVIVPPGRSAAGLEVHLLPWQHDVKRVTDAEGRFRFEGLTAGTHRLALAEAPGILTGLSAEVTLAAGESRAVVLDARGSGTCAVTLAIELGGRPAAGLAVFLRPLDEPDERHELGATDADGRVSGWAPARGRMRVEIVLPTAARLLHPDPVGPLELDVPFEARVRFEVGSLRLELPAALALPAEGSASLVLTRVGDASAYTVRRLRLPFDPAHADLVLEPRGILCDNLLPGDYELTFALTDAATPAERIPQPGGLRVEQPALYRVATRVSVRANEVTRVEQR